jgi:hypothetical protein
MLVQRLETRLTCNTTASDSQDAGISADGNNVVITWWDRNQHQMNLQLK